LEWNKPLVQLCPLCIQSHRIGNHQKHHLLHGAGSSKSETGAIKGFSGLADLRCPTKIGFERCRVLEVSNCTNCRNHHGCLDWADNTHGKENFSLPGLLDNVTEFAIQLLKMFLKHFQFFNQLRLFKNKA